MSTPESFDIERTRREIVTRLQPGEDVEAVLRAGIFLARKRADTLGRAATQADLEYSLSIICVWPFKTPPADEVSRDLRGARIGPINDAGRGDFSALDRLIPTATLVATPSELAAAQQRSITSFLNPEFRER